MTSAGSASAVLPFSTDLRWASRSMPSSRRCPVSGPARTAFSSAWVDDKPANNEHERAELRANGIVFDNVVSTMEAIAQLQTSTYDLVITDLGRMWSSDGSLEAGHRLLAEPVIADGGPPVIVYGHPQYAPQEREKLYQLGVYGVSWMPHQLFALVLRALGRAPVS